VGEEKIKWHPAFAAAIQLEFKDYKDHLDFKIEHQLTAEPLRIDVVVIKKLDDIEIDKTMGKIFRKYNVMEYKSPTDYFSIDDYYKVRAYAYLYKVLSEKTNPISIEEITISIVVNKYPNKLIKYLKEKQGVNTSQIEKGIYYIENTDIKTQIIVNNKNLNKKDSEYLKLLQIKQQDSGLLEKWINEYARNTKDPLYSIIMNVLTEINTNSILEVYKKMGVPQISEENREFLLEAIKKLQIDKKIREEGIEEGIEKGIEKEVKQRIEKEVKERIEKIKKSLIKGYSVETITEILEVSNEDVERVRKQMK